MARYTCPTDLEQTLSFRVLRGRIEVTHDRALCYEKKGIKWVKLRRSKDGRLRDESEGLAGGPLPPGSVESVSICLIPVRESGEAAIASSGTGWQQNDCRYVIQPRLPSTLEE